MPPSPDKEETLTARFEGTSTSIALVRALSVRYIATCASVPISSSLVGVDVTKNTV